MRQRVERIPAGPDRVAAAHADYGHEGPDWSAFFYEKLGGSMPDLAVYNLTSLTGLLGPAKSVAAMLSVVTPERTVGDKGRVTVEEEDNAMVLVQVAGLARGDGAVSRRSTGAGDRAPPPPRRPGRAKR